jgi:sigma-B regulation protein RsbU (phosphoserine phosphatase)
MEGSHDTINQIPCGYFSFTEAGIVAEINRTLLNQLGYEREEVVGKTVEVLLPIASRIFYQTHFYPLLTLQGSANEIFLTLRSHMGEDVPVLLNAVSAQQDNAKIYRCVCIAVWQRQKYEEALLHARQVAEQALYENKELIEAKQDLERHQQLLDKQLVELQQKNQELFQVGKLITHDLQEPLRKITLLADLMRHNDDKNLEGESSQLLDKIVGASRNLRGLIHRLREYIQFEIARYDFAPVELNAILLKAQTRISLIHQTTDIQLTVEQLPQIDGDSKQLTELFAQLIDNSVRHRPQSADSPVEITIKGHLIEHNSFQTIQEKYNYVKYIQITYTDNGPGLDKRLAEKAFQIHKRVDSGFLGLGFGLAICKKIVDNHGGIISVNSENKLGTGAHFNILLPAKQH